MHGTALDSRASDRLRRSADGVNSPRDGTPNLTPPPAAGKAVEGGLHSAHRTSTFLSCAFREQEDDQVTRSFRLCQVIKHSSNTFSRLRKNSVYTEKTVALFRMVL